MPMPMPMPMRQVRAAFTDETITVYQAYSPAIADAALRAGRFVAPFKRDRMTWIKPSFLWMMYRCGWATKPGQERVLAVAITRDGFEWALSHSSLSYYEAGTYASEAEWAERKAMSPVRVQWDPERSLGLGPLDHRAIQVGLSGIAATHYVDDWIVGITDVTSTARDIANLVGHNVLAAAENLLPAERPYPLPDHIARAVGAGRQETDEGSSPSSASTAS